MAYEFKLSWEKLPLQEYHSHGFIRAEGKLKYAFSPIYGKDGVLLNLDKCHDGSPNHQFYLRPFLFFTHPTWVRNLLLCLFPLESVYWCLGTKSGVSSV